MTFYLENNSQLSVTVVYLIICSCTIHDCVFFQVFASFPLLSTKETQAFSLNSVFLSFQCQIMPHLSVFLLGSNNMSSETILI